MEDDEIQINSSNGSGAVIRPVFYDGFLTIEANSTFNDSVQDHNVSAKVRVRASMQDLLTHQEQWLDQYLDSIVEQNSSWWQSNLNTSVDFEDLDDDNLTNYMEWLFGSNPTQQDTDLDTLADFDEFKLFLEPNACGY